MSLGRCHAPDVMRQMRCTNSFNEYTAETSHFVPGWIKPSWVHDYNASIPWSWLDQTILGPRLQRLSTVELVGSNHPGSTTTTPLYRGAGWIKPSWVHDYNASTLWSWLDQTILGPRLQRLYTVELQDPPRTSLSLQSSH